ncbi:hypothetical protein MUCCIDRAFT_84203 [Mucor lusitanicus CBS 277.49]|uniref:Uncharacterized protein n=1 Tax=Mucor lusitanicus CBS 277.49 TaxID=747725 RepID=A0A168HW86_MUCCL|nr:hypothetical protein MUCCIDRAFT_84203 [Mucor lusitanicus CBS 277.49]
MCFEHHVCVMGCMLFPEDDPLLIACTFCNSPRYKNHSQVDAFVKNGGVLNATSASFFVPRQVIQIGSVASCLGELLVDEQKLQDLTYKHKFHDDPAYYRSDYYEDIFSGEVYQEFREKGVIQRNDICLMLTVDGFCNKNSPKNSSVLIHCTVLNFSPDKRYQKQSMISLAIVGGKPKDLMSFLKPILQEIHQLSNEGLQVRKNDKIVYSGFVHLLGCTGDVPALAELMGHDGHMSKYGCKTCLVKGRRCSGTGTGMYFCYKGADRTIEDLKLGDSTTNLKEMDICFNDWHYYLRECILSNKLSERVFTVNMHALCHLKHLVLRLGPMRAYSCRSMELTIKFFSTLITGTTNVAANASNVMLHDLHYRCFAVIKLQIKHFPPKQFDPKTYKVYPHATEVDMGELWRPFQMQNIKYVAKTSSSVVCFGIPQYKVVKALVNYYSRTEGEKLPVDWINWGTVELASALEKDGIVYGSVMHRRRRHLKTRANNVVLFKAIRKIGERRVNVWLVATIQCFFIHKQDGVTRFLVLGKVMKKNAMDDHHVITVTEFASTDQDINLILKAAGS